MASDLPFLLPVVVDDTPDQEDRVPDRFREVQWTRLLGGTKADAFVDHVRRLLSPDATPPTRTSVGSSALPKSTAGAAATLSTPLASRSFVPLILIGVVILAIGYLAVDKFWLSRPSMVEPPAPAVAPTVAAFNPPARSIAVLPFVNMSGDSNQEYFSDGVSEELLNALSRLDTLQVVARTSSFSFKGQNADVSTIARKLNVGAILEGSVRRGGNTVRIPVQLINTVTGFHIWSQTYDRSMTDILKIQTDVAKAVADQLKVKLVDSDTVRIAMGGTSNPAAYDAYLRAAQLQFGAEATSDTFKSAAAGFRQAVALDPNYASAYVGLALALSNLASSTVNIRTFARLRQEAITAAEHAVIRAPDLGEAHAALATVRRHGLDFAGAASEYDRALQLSPGSAMVQRTYAYFAADLGHFAAALAAARRAVQFDPQSVVSLYHLAFVLESARRYDEELATLKEAEMFAPNARSIAEAYVSALLASGQFKQAAQRCESAPSLLDESTQHLCLSLAYHAIGKQGEAEREFMEFKKNDRNVDAYEYAQFYAQWGDRAPLYSG